MRSMVERDAPVWRTVARALKDIVSGSGDACASLSTTLRVVPLPLLGEERHQSCASM